MATYGPTGCSLDTMIAEFVPNRVYGAGNFVQISYAYAGQKNKGLISWDVSSIPVGATVSAASIVLSYSAETLSTDRPATVYPCKRLIVEGTGAGSETADGTTWNKYNVADDWQTAGGEGANDYDSASGSAFTLTNSTADITIDALTAVSAALASYRSGNYITLLFQADAVWSANEYWRGDSRAVTSATLTVTYTTTTALTVTRADDYDPNQTAVSGTLRWALFNQSGDRSVTVDAAVVTSGIDLDPSPTYGPVRIINTNCAFDGGGVVINEWGITVATPDVQLEDFVLEPNDSDDGRGLVITDGSSQQTLTAITVTGMTVLANGDDPVSIQQQTYGSSIAAAFTNITVDSATEDLASKGLLVSGPSTGAINGTFTYDHYDIGGTEPVAGRIPLIFGGLHTFTDCEFVQGWSTTDIKAAHVNWIRCNWVTRAQPPGATFWYAGRLVMVSFPATTRMYFEDCTLDGVPVTYTSLCKVRSVSGDVDIDAGVISGTLLATIPQNPTPTISNLSPSSYFAGGVNNVVITGTGFRPNSTVTVNSVSVPFTLTDDVNGTIITARVPSNVFAAPGTFNVTVSNPAPTGGTSSASSLTVTGLGRRSGGTSCMIATGTI